MSYATTTPPRAAETGGSTATTTQMASTACVAAPADTPLPLKATLAVAQGVLNPTTTHQRPYCRVVHQKPANQVGVQVP